jgi:DNA-binding NtrC family response regulator
MHTKEEIDARDIDAAIVELPGRDSPGPFSRNRGSDFRLKERLRQIERVFVEDALRETDGDETKAAEMLGISQQALNRKVKIRKIQVAPRKRGRRRR